MSNKAVMKKLADLIKVSSADANLVVQAAQNLNAWVLHSSSNQFKHYHKTYLIDLADTMADLSSDPLENISIYSISATSLTDSASQENLPASLVDMVQAFVERKIADETRCYRYAQQLLMAKAWGTSSALLN